MYAHWSQVQAHHYCRSGLVPAVMS